MDLERLDAEIGAKVRRKLDRGLMPKAQVPADARRSF